MICHEGICAFLNIREQYGHNGGKKDYLRKRLEELK